jgi:hypothetical protein
MALAQVAHQMCEEGRLWLPSMNECDAVELPMAAVGDIAEIGPYHMDVSGNTSDRRARGPFEISRVEAGGAPTYPILWSHDAERERTMEFEADSEGIVRTSRGCDDP